MVVNLRHQRAPVRQSTVQALSSLITASGYISKQNEELILNGIAPVVAYDRTSSVRQQLVAEALVWLKLPRTGMDF